MSVVVVMAGGAVVSAIGVAVDAGYVVVVVDAITIIGVGIGVAVGVTGNYDVVVGVGVADVGCIVVDAVFVIVRVVVWWFGC